MYHLILVFVGLLKGISGWNCDGHRIIAMIAGELVNKNTRRFIREHLPYREGTRIRKHTSALIDAACWADSVVDTLPWSADLHFVHTPYRDCQVYNEDRDCGFKKSGRCIVTGIANYTARASDHSLDESDRSDALKFLIHLVGDIHQPLHAGFAEDYGGVSISLSHPPDYSLHEVWDSHLVSGLNKDGFSWVDLASSLFEEMGEIESLEKPSPVAEAKSFAERIVSETTRELTCRVAYTDEDWISSGDALSRRYIERGRRVVREQFKRAGDRLSQILDSAANRFYSSVRISRRSPSLEQVELRNRYEMLEMEFEPEDHVFTVVKERGKASKVRNRDEPDDVACSAEVESASRTKNQKKRDRKKANKSKVSGVDLDALVLIKRIPGFFITYESLVESDSYIPLRSLTVSVDFSHSKRQFHFDSQVFAGVELSPLFLKAVFQKLRGIDLIDTVQPVAEIQLHGWDTKVIGKITAIWANAVGFDLRDFKDDSHVYEGPWSLGPPVRLAALSSVADVIAKKHSPRELRAIYDGRLPSETERINDNFRKVKKGLIIGQIGDILLVTSDKFLEDYKNVRWVFNVYAFVDPTVETVENQFLAMDVRVADDELTSEIGEELMRIGGSFDCKSKLRNLLDRKTPPPLFKKISVLNKLISPRDDPLVPFEIIAEFHTISQIHRPEKTAFITVEIITRSPQATTRARQHMRLDNPRIPLSERTSLAEEFLSMTLKESSTPLP